MMLKKIGFGHDLDNDFEDDGRTMMRELETFYKAHADTTASVVQKGALEMNMFSNERVTFEGLFREKILGLKGPHPKEQKD
jgi:hypothetical protein